MRKYIGLLVLSAALLPLAAHAQGSPLEAKSLDLYPSFLEVNGTANGVSPGSEFGLRCGLSYNNGVRSLNGFLEISFINPATKEYARYQNIFGKYTVMSFPPDGGGQRAIVEVIEPDGTARAKNCLADVNNDALSDCHPINSFMTLAQTQPWLQIGAQACDAAMIQKAPDLNRSAPPSPQEQSSFQQKLDQRLKLLEN